jgi:hypothetical protein
LEGKILSRNKTPPWGGGRIKKNDGGGDFKYDIFDIL